MKFILKTAYESFKVNVFFLQDYSRDGNNRGKKSGGTRERRRCPLFDCKAKVVRVPRHLQDVHGWSRMHAKTALVRYGMRKTYSCSHPKKAPKNKKQSEEEASKSKGSKDYHYYRYCPLQGCTSLVKRPPPHLAKVHKLPPDEVKRTLSKVPYLPVYKPHPQISRTPSLGEDFQEKKFIDFTDLCFLPTDFLD